jgi:hypothetical protein
VSSTIFFGVTAGGTYTTTVLEEVKRGKTIQSDAGLRDQQTAGNLLMKDV